ncbi:MAG: hypothetical protein JXA13_08165 [Anaerolineales bacterium]|nr:hypothetical protein [Anaerolineales bacterium]
MTPQMVVFALVSFFHDLFTAIWMGGLLVSVLAFLPAVSETLGPGPQVKRVMAAFQKRQGVWVYVSMAGLILTGLLMGNRSPEYQGWLHFGNPYSIALSIKHLLVIAMIAIALYRTLTLGKMPASPGKERLNQRLLIANVVLVVFVLLSSGFVAALSHPLVAG